MNRQKWTLLLLAFAMICGAAGALTRLRADQKLGQPGIRTAAIPGSIRLSIPLPEHVLYYDSTNVPTSQAVLDGLPHDTSFAQRLYAAPQDQSDELQLMVVLMGTDRTSIHKPQFCLKGSGWDFDDENSRADTVRIQSPHPYDLPVTKMLMTRTVMSASGEPVRFSGIYVYWFIADHQLTGSHFTRMWSTASHLLQTGELQRWAYVGCLGVCRPGEESATYERMKRFIAATVPEFQLTTGPDLAGAAPAQTAER
jgi:hypothetical protein